MDSPFDARRVMLDDDDQPTPERRTVSLVTALRAALAEVTPSTISPDPRIRDLQAIADELTRRGVDGTCVVRYGMAPELVAGIVVRALPHWLPPLRALMSSTSPVPGPSGSQANAAPQETTWADLLGSLIQLDIAVPPIAVLTPDSLRPLINEIAAKVYPWVLTASLDELLCLRAPTAEWLTAAASETPPESSTLEEYRWLADRFAVTHLQDWDTTSLHREYNWRRGTHPAPCPETLMDDRQVAAEELNAEIARRTVESEPSQRIQSPAGLDQALLHRLKINAVGLLSDNRPHEAAALFQFALNETPHDVDLLNNLGFCLIPQDPRRALGKLEDADQRGFTPMEVNLHNRALCKFLLGEYQAALDLIDNSWHRVSGVLSLLWRPGGDQLQLRLHTHSDNELAYLAHHAATFLGDEKAIEHWAQIADELDNHDRPTD